MKRIPFNKPFIVGKELSYVAQTVFEGHTAGDGIFTLKCREWMERVFNSYSALLTHSCTASLEMAAILIDIKPGDEVIVPSYTFVSTANAFVLRGAKIVFCDIEYETLNIDYNLIRSLITNKTRAIVPVHYAGVSCRMNEIMEIAEKYNLIVIEDAAQGFYAKYENRYLGTIGHLGCFSFHETKNLISGEGGALLVNDERFVDRAEIIREKGTNRKMFLEGIVDKYTWVDIGSSYLPSDIIASFFYAQLESVDLITTRRLEIYNRYCEKLQYLEEKSYVKLPTVPNGCKHNAHMFYILIDPIYNRKKVIEHLEKQNIQAVFHYIPLHSSPMGKKVGRFNDMTITNDLSSRVLRLPCYLEMSNEDVDRVCNQLIRFFE